VANAKERQMRGFPLRSPENLSGWTSIYRSEPRSLDCHQPAIRTAEIGTRWWEDGSACHLFVFSLLHQSHADLGVSPKQVRAIHSVFYDSQHISEIGWMRRINPFSMRTNVGRRFVQRKPLRVTAPASATAIRPPWQVSRRSGGVAEFKVVGCISSVHGVSHDSIIFMGPGGCDL